MKHIFPFVSVIEPKDHLVQGLHEFLKFHLDYKQILHLTPTTLINAHQLVLFTRCLLN